MISGIIRLPVSTSLSRKAQGKAVLGPNEDKKPLFRYNPGPMISEPMKKAFQQVREALNRANAQELETRRLWLQCVIETHEAFPGPDSEALVHEAAGLLLDIERIKLKPRPCVPIV